MELREFVKKSLLDIMGGVSDAQNVTSDGTIIPVVVSTSRDSDARVIDYQVISFDISVNTSDKEGSEAKLNVFAGIIGSYAKGESSNTSGRSANLSFNVPIRFPRKFINIKKNNLV